jgi:hypothetical protein
MNSDERKILTKERNRQAKNIYVMKNKNGREA